MNVREFLKANLKECQEELLKYDATGYLATGKVLEAMTFFSVGSFGTIKGDKRFEALKTVKSIIQELSSEEKTESGFVKGITVPNISAFIIGTEIVILFKNKDSLLKFDCPWMNNPEVLPDVLANVINEKLSGLDWDNTFGYVFSHQEYRKAVVSVIEGLI